MPDRETVIKGLQHCDFGGFGTCYEKDCPYYPIHACTDELKNDILVMLKEQEAVEPEVEVLNEIDRIYRCPKCHKFFLYEKQKYCDRCGQAVKWDDGH